MPQTTEEHMELENDDDDKSDSEKIPDAEVSVNKYCFWKEEKSVRSNQNILFIYSINSLGITKG